MEMEVAGQNTFHNGVPYVELEVEVYIKVIFKVQTWDGITRTHETDLPGHVTIGDLKEELKYELGDPKLSDWVIAKSGVRMSDDKVIHKNYSLQHNDEINVFVYKKPINDKQDDH